MAETFEFYDARANEAAAEAKTADLVNVRERALRAEKTWRGLATQAMKVLSDREKAEIARAERRAAEAEEAAALAAAKERTRTALPGHDSPFLVVLANAGIQPPLGPEGETGALRAGAFLAGFPPAPE